METLKLSPSRWLAKHTFSVILLAAAIISSVISVRVWKERHPGSMSVIEAQGMDMTAMKPPVGTVPVATEIVHSAAFTAKVTYSGSVAPYTEQDVFPRAEGYLTRLTAYNGSSVRA